MESKVSDIITALKQNIDDDLRAESEKLSRKVQTLHTVIKRVCIYVYLCDCLLTDGRHDS